MPPSAICGRIADFCVLVAGEPQRRAAEHDGRQIRLQREDAPERLHNQHHFDRAAAEPAVVLGKRQTQQAELGILCPNPAAPTLGLGEVGAALIEPVMVGEQPVDRVAQQPLLFGQIEIHRLGLPIVITGLDPMIYASLDAGGSSVGHVDGRIKSGQPRPRPAMGVLLGLFR